VTRVQRRTLVLPQRAAQRPLTQWVVGIATGLFFATLGTVIGIECPSMRFAQAVVVACMVFPAIYLTLTKSSHLIPYILMTYVLSPEVRRVIDYSAGTYTSVTLISITPLLATATLVFPVLSNWRRIPRPVLIPICMLGFSCIYALVVGMAHYGIAAVPEFATWALPLLVLPYLASSSADQAERDNWLKAFALIAVGVGAYTWVQFVTAPPWDMDWLISSGMTSSMGQPNPMEFRAFGPLNSTGTAGFFFPFLIAAVWTAKPLRNQWGAFAGIVVASALAITEVRAGWLMAGAMIAAGLVMRRKSSWWRQIAILAVVMGLFAVVIPLLPGGDRVTDRLQTFGNLENDDSANARAATTTSLVRQVIGDPIGTGFGASAVGKVSGDSTMVCGIDNGFMAILVYFGWPGATLFFVALIMLVRLSSSLRRSPTDARPDLLVDLQRKPLALTAFFGMLVGTLAFTAFAGLSAYVGWMLYGLMLSRVSEDRPRAFADVETCQVVVPFLQESRRSERQT
jgi:putative inorganic carbon (HCO3(-)) transporter